MSSSHISGCRAWGLGRADYKRENCAQQHDSGNYVESLGVLARALAHLRDQGWAKDAGEAPGRQHQPVNRPDISRTKKVGGKRRHGAETPATAQQDPQAQTAQPPEPAT